MRCVCVWGICFYLLDFTLGQFTFRKRVQVSLDHWIVFYLRGGESIVKIYICTVHASWLERPCNQIVFFGFSQITPSLTMKKIRQWGGLFSCMTEVKNCSLFLAPRLYFRSIRRDSNGNHGFRFRSHSFGDKLKSCGFRQAIHGIPQIRAPLGQSNLRISFSRGCICNCMTPT